MNTMTLLSATIGVVIALLVTAGVAVTLFTKPKGFENDLDV